MGMSFELFSFELFGEAYQNSQIKIEYEHLTPAYAPKYTKRY
jgi:phage protein U